eukprot:TRINITY_DN5779_c0_g1_i2.p1 TRINITY_DN5779_c0_g1~~TRINITY_DN5779_c0_g1_i2.p1  ORF type:complete len:545 (-),score=128.17 TRINITY_DN5779_c0_g1_i2:151-1785(-)
MASWLQSELVGAVQGLQVDESLMWPGAAGAQADCWMAARGDWQRFQSVAAATRAVGLSPLAAPGAFDHPVDAAGWPRFDGHASFQASPSHAFPPIAAPTTPAAVLPVQAPPPPPSAPPQGLPNLDVPAECIPAAPEAPPSIDLSPKREGGGSSARRAGLLGRSPPVELNLADMLPSEKRKAAATPLRSPVEADRASAAANREVLQSPPGLLQMPSLPGTAAPSPSASPSSWQAKASSPQYVASPAAAKTSTGAPASTPVKLTMSGLSLRFDFEREELAPLAADKTTRSSPSPICLADRLIGPEPVFPAPAPLEMAPTAAQLQAWSHKAPPPAPPLAPPTLPVGILAQHAEVAPPVFDAASLSEGGDTSTCGKRTPSTRSSEYAPVELSLADMITPQAAGALAVSEPSLVKTPMSAGAAVFVPVSDLQRNLSEELHDSAEEDEEPLSFVESRAQMLLVRHYMMLAKTSSKVSTTAGTSAKLASVPLERSSSCSTASSRGEDSNDGTPSFTASEEMPTNPKSYVQRGSGEASDSPGSRASCKAPRA